MAVHAPLRLETERLVLRPPQPADEAAIFAAYASDPDVTRFLAWPTHRSLDDTRAFREFSQAQWRRWPAGPYLVIRREDDVVIGSTGVQFETPTCASTGYVLAKSAWGVGLATEALSAIVAVAPVLGLSRLYAVCHVSHAASARVLEKCGFLREGVLRAHAEFPNLSPRRLADVLCYGRVW